MPVAIPDDDFVTTGTSGSGCCCGDTTQCGSCPPLTPSRYYLCVTRVAAVIHPGAPFDFVNCFDVDYTLSSPFCVQGHIPFGPASTIAVEWYDDSSGGWPSPLRVCATYPLAGTQSVEICIGGRVICVPGPPADHYQFQPDILVTYKDSAPVFPCDGGDLPNFGILFTDVMITADCDLDSLLGDYIISIAIPPFVSAATLYYSFVKV